MCHTALAWAAALLTLGCAARSGWERTDARACRPADPPRICVLAEPDRALVVRAGGTALVPGECASSPRRRGGSLHVTAEDGRTGARDDRWLRTGRGATTRITATNKAKPRVVERDRCTGQIEADMAEGSSAARGRE
ncbi:hypothetical protein [Nannocystis bainbridge]|uniref:Uncharacterized protein n=1 Tax=Nannocystis bainbridge TaxID=2995303 RepID=A0ABT5EAU4_9BACT|nr:hypothetical protein [Nannocystis bainbridge]MDC0722967.1 hypothetical protein [Nannocystis bainbridge]